MKPPCYTLLVLSMEQSLSALYGELRQALGDQNCRLLLAGNAEDATHQLQQHTIHAILTDEQPEALALLQDLQPTSGNNPPLTCVLVTAGGELLTEIAHIDILLPLVPVPLLVHQLQRHLGRQQQLNDLRRKDSELTLLKNAIVHNVSHELKTPLLQVKSAVSLIAEDINNSVSQMAVTATTRLEMVVKNITLLADGMHADMHAIILNQAVDMALRNLRRSWQYKDDTGRVNCHFPEQIPPVMANQQGLSIVIQQLIENALKFSKETQSPVDVKVTFQGERVCISVADQGIGIAPDKLSQIFDTFYQVDSSSTKKYSGMGAGLAIVSLILDNHDVKIHVESKLGRGSTFWFELDTAEI